jgi:DNA polymerase III subunit delta'
MPFAEFLGNSRIVTALRGMLGTEQVPHAMLFAGPRGVGKFTLARMFAQAANCERLRDDFCGECGPCRAIARLQNTSMLIEQGLAERGESLDTATVERVPLLLETHPDVWAIVPDPVRLKNPVVRPILHVGQLRAVQRAAYFKPLARRRVFIIDGAETMRWDHANIFLKILEEPPETATLMLLAPNPHLLLPTIRSRCLQFLFSPLAQEQVEQLMRRRDDLSASQRKLGAQMAEGSPGAALAMDVAEAIELRKTILEILATVIEKRSPGELFSQTAHLVKTQKTPFETVLELFYSLLNDLLELSAGFAGQGVRNPALGKELAKLSRQVDTAWIASAVGALDELEGRMRRNVNRQLGLDAIALSLAEVLQK